MLHDITTRHRKSTVGVFKKTVGLSVISPEHDGPGIFLDGSAARSKLTQVGSLSVPVSGFEGSLFFVMVNIVRSSNAAIMLI